MWSQKVGQPMLLLVLLHVSVEIVAICPAGYVESMGLCYPAASSSSTNNLSPCQTQAMATPCSSQVLCANLPVTPCTTQQIQPCPTQLFPSPHTQPVQPCPAQPIQPVQPCPNQPIQPVQPCPNQPLQPVQPCPNQPIQPVPPCPNQPLQPVQPCPNQPIQPVQPCPNQPIQPVPPCPNQPLQPVQPIDPVTTTAPTSCETTTTTTYPPDPIRRCPEGTLLINGVCRLIYCGKGVYKDGKCVQTQCRPGTVWTGVQCAPPAPIVQSIVMNNTVITHFNRTEPDVIVNNVNNLVVNATDDMDAGYFTAPNCTDVDSGEATSSCPPHVVTPPPGQTNKCCAVVTPRMCRRSEAGDHWNCFSKRYRRCGDFCIAPTIYLKPPMMRDTNHSLVMLPNHALSDCRRAGTCAESLNYHDCSGCALGMEENCSSYCFKSTCGTRSCRFYDQQLYCGRFPGQAGCQETDGCVDDWCSNDEY